jgi:hypothetical protein
MKGMTGMKHYTIFAPNGENIETIEASNYSNARREWAKKYTGKGYMVREGETGEVWQPNFKAERGWAL